MGSALHALQKLGTEVRSLTVKALVGLLSMSLALASCKRIDPISARANRGGTAYLLDIAVGSDERLICVRSSVQESCLPETADVHVKNLPSLGHIRSWWEDDYTVLVHVDAGDVVRFPFPNDMFAGRVRIRRDK